MIMTLDDLHDSLCPSLSSLCVTGTSSETLILGLITCGDLWRFWQLGSTVADPPWDNFVQDPASSPLSTDGPTGDLELGRCDADALESDRPLDGHRLDFRPNITEYRSGGVT